LLFGRNLQQQHSINSFQLNLLLIVMLYQLGIGQAGLSTVVGLLGLKPSLTNCRGWKLAEELVGAAVTKVCDQSMQNNLLTKIDQTMAAGV
jgi:hypothetical protein